LHCNYTLLIDIDEFLYINKNTTIKTFLQNKQCHLYTSHRFAYFEDKETLHSTLYHTSEVSPRNGKTILFNKSILPSTIINIHKTPQSVHYYPLKLLHIKPKQEQFLYKEKILNFNEIF
jgi:hypothetical protein